MTIFLGVILLVVGLVFGLGLVDLPDAVLGTVDTGTLGWIVAVIGLLTLALGLVQALRSDPPRAASSRREDPPAR